MSRSSRGLSSEDEFEASAVAAAAFAVNALEDLNGTIRKKPASLSSQASSLIKTESKKDKATQPPEPGGFPPLTSSEVSTTKSERSPEEQARSTNLQKRHTFTDRLTDKSDSTSPVIPTPPPPSPPPPASPPQPPPPAPLPSPQRPSQPIGRPSTPRLPVYPSTTKPETSSPKPNKLSATSFRHPQKAASGSSSRGQTRADIWEMTEMEKIRERYEKLNETIASWEEGKKKKAKAKLEKKESEPPKRRLKAMEKFKEEMASINQIAGGARAKAEERRRKEELKVKKKADAYRRTGKFPRTCLCF